MPISSTDVQNLISSQMQQLAAMQQVIHQFNTTGAQAQLSPQSMSGQAYDPTAGQLSDIGGQVATGMANIPAAAMGIAGTAAMLQMAPGAFDPMMGAFGVGSMAAKAGGLGAGLAVGGAALGAYAAAGSAFNYMVADPFRTGAQMMGSATNFASQLFPQQSIQNLQPFATTLLGASQTLINPMMGQPTYPEMQALVMQGIGANVLNPRGSMSDFNQQLRGVIDTTRQFAGATNQNMNDAFASRQTLLDMGASRGQLVNDYRMMQSGETLGISMPEMMQAAEMGAQGAHAMGVDRQRGMAGAMSQTLMFKRIMRDRTMDIDESDIGAFNNAGSRFFQGVHGQRTLAAMMDDSGGFNEDAAAQIASGAMSRQEINRRSSRVMNNASRLDEFSANQEQLAGTFLSEYGPQGVSAVSRTMTRGLAHGSIQRMQDLGLSGKQLQSFDQLSLVEGGIQDANRADSAAEMEAAFKQGMGHSVTDLMGQVAGRVTKSFRDRMQRLGEDVSGSVSRAADNLANEFSGRIDQSPADMSGANAAYRMISRGDVAGGRALYADMERAAADLPRQPAAGMARHNFGSSFLPRALYAGAEGLTANDLMQLPGYGLLPEGGSVSDDLVGAGALAGGGALGWLGGTALAAAGSSKFMAGLKAGGQAIGGSTLAHMMAGEGLAAGTAAAAGGAMTVGGMGLAALGGAATIGSALMTGKAVFDAGIGIAEAGGLVERGDIPVGDARKQIQAMQQAGLLKRHVVQTDALGGPTEVSGDDYDKAFRQEHTGDMDTGLFHFMGGVAMQGLRGLASTVSGTARDLFDVGTGHNMSTASGRGRNYKGNKGYVFGGSENALGHNYETYYEAAELEKARKDLFNPKGLEASMKTFYNLAPEKRTALRAMAPTGNVEGMQELMGSGTTVTQVEQLRAALGVVGDTGRLDQKMLQENKRKTLAALGGTTDEQNEIYRGIQAAQEKGFLSHGMSNEDVTSTLVERGFLPEKLAQRAGNNAAGLLRASSMERAAGLDEWGQRVQQRKLGAIASGDWEKSISYATGASGVNMHEVMAHYQGYTSTTMADNARDAFLEIVKKPIDGAQAAAIAKQFLSSSDPLERDIGGRLSTVPTVLQAYQRYDKDPKGSRKRTSDAMHIIGETLGGDIGNDKSMREFLEGKHSYYGGAVQDKMTGMLTNMGITDQDQQRRLIGDLVGSLRPGGDNTKEALMKAVGQIQSTGRAPAMPGTARPGGEADALSENAKKVSTALAGVATVMEQFVKDHPTS